MVKRYLPYVLLYVLGVASAWGLFQITHSSSDGAQVASAAAEPAHSTIRSAKSRRPVAAAPRMVKPKRVAKPKRLVKKPRVSKKKRVAKKKPARKPSTTGATLRNAVAKGDQRTVKRLLASKKHDVNTVDKRGRSLLMTAVRKGHSDVRRLTR